MAGVNIKGHDGVSARDRRTAIQGVDMVDKVEDWLASSADAGRNVTQWPETMTAYLEQTIKTCIKSSIYRSED